jgi:hypothetical protein
MTDQTPAALLRAAAETVRQWATDATADPWAPDAVARFGPELAEWLETEASSSAGDESHADCAASTCTTIAALAVARKILGGES